MNFFFPPIHAGCFSESLVYLAMSTLAVILASLLLCEGATAQTNTQAQPHEHPPSYHRPDHNLFREALTPILEEEKHKGGALPPEVEARAQKWRDRLASAKVMKITCELDQTWRYLDEVDERGVPRVYARERYQAHAWMTPETEWLVMYLVSDGPDGKPVPDIERPVLQQLWANGTVWERVWQPQYSAYRTSKYTAPEPSGANTSALDSKGCIYGTVLGSWLASNYDATSRSTVMLTRGSRPATMPPGDENRGSWLLLCEPYIERDKEGPEHISYARIDYGLLSESDQVTEWRTRVLFGSTKRPQDSVALRHLRYLFLPSPPPELKDITSAFRRLVDETQQSASDAPPR
jgi:hypothetical protein